MGIKIRIRERFDKTLVAYCDESCHNAHRYFVVGGVFFGLKPGANVDDAIRDIESELQATKDKYSLRTVKWGNIPTKQNKIFDGYQFYLREFLETEHAYFKCMVVDTSNYPLANRKLWGGDPLVGYLKFYCVFLSDGLLSRYRDYYCHIRIDQFEFRPDCDCALLEETVAKRFVKKSKPDPCLEYCSVEALDHRKHNLLQLADLLVGAVAFVWNGGMRRESARAATRKELVSMIEKARNVDLGKPTPWSKQDFNIWALTPRSSGSRGRPDSLS